MVNDNQFTKLFKYMVGMKSDIDRRFDDAKKERSSILTLIDNLSAQVDNNHQELVALISKTDRHERWIHQIADKTKVKLSYE